MMQLRNHIWDGALSCSFTTTPLFIVAEELTTRWFDEYGEPMQIHTDQVAELGIVVSLDALLLIGAYVFQATDCVSFESMTTDAELL